MAEILQHPAFYPALISFVVTLILSAIFAGFRVDSVRLEARNREKKLARKVAELEADETVLRAELQNQRTSEADLIKKIGVLEYRSKDDRRRQEEMAQFLGFAKSTLQTELRKHENAIIGAIKRPEATATFATPRATTQINDRDDRDFVPLQGQAKEVPREKSFEGFVEEKAQNKAGSAADVFRAALKNPES